MKIWFFGIVVLVVAGGVALPRAEYAAWTEVDDRSSLMFRHYFVIVDTVTCSVAVPRDRQGIVVQGTNHDWYGKVVRYTAIIRKTQSGPVKAASGTVINKESKEKETTPAYDVFAWHCAPLVRFLPAETRELFLGFYGTESTTQPL